MLEVAMRAAILTAAVFQTAFVILYASRPWWRHFVGRALLTKSAALMVLVDVAVVHWVVDYPAEELVEVCLYWCVAAAIGFQLGALVWQQRIDRRTGA